MQRKTSSAPTRVYSYGGPFGPIVEAPRVREQMRLAHKYQNDLITVELARRAAYRMEIARAGDVEVIDAQMRTFVEELEGLETRVRAARAVTRSRGISKTEAERAAWLKRELQRLRRERKEVAKRVREDAGLKARLDEQNTRASDMHKALRAKNGVYWGTYLLVEAAVERQRKSTMDPKHRRWQGQGRIGVQIQGGISVDKLFAGTDTRVRCTAPDERGRCVLSIRVGSEGRDPVWATFPMIYHRDMPADALIKGVTCTVQRIAYRERWHVQFALEAASLYVPTRPAVRVAALNLGWRQMDTDLLRLGYLVDNATHKDSILVQRDTAPAHADSLRSIRDREFNGVRATLEVWLAGQESLPTWLTDRVPHIPLWKSPGRLLALTELWTTQRFEGDETIYEVLEAWTKQEKHLHQWEADVRVKAVLRRKDRYRNLAARLAKAYDVLILSDANYQELSRKQGIGFETELRNATAQSNRTLLAPGEFRLLLKEACAKYGAEFVQVPAAHTTRTCHVCGTANVFDAAEDVTHRCTHCSAVWDQDENAARNMLALYQAARVSEG